MNSFKKGFTLIELLVVVAIIGILASVVLASLNNARSKGNDAGAKSNLRNALSQGEVFYLTNTAAANTYTNFCSNTNQIGGANTVNTFMTSAIKNEGLGSYAINAVGSATTATCNSDNTNGTAWAAEIPLAGSTTASPIMWCVDSTSKSKLENVSSLSAINDYTCN